MELFLTLFFAILFVITVLYCKDVAILLYEFYEELKIKKEIEKEEREYREYEEFIKKYY